MKKIIDVLEKTYLIFFLILLLLSITINYFIQSSFRLSQNIILEEEHVESFCIVVIFFIGFIALKFYEREIFKKDSKIKMEVREKIDLKKRLEDDFRYIGKINVQMQEIEKVMSGLKKFPENKTDFNNIHNFLLNEVLGIVNTEWLISRVVYLKNEKVLHEKIVTRKEVTILKQQISTKQLLGGDKFKDCITVKSKQNNLGLKVFFILPKKKYGKNDYILMQAVIQQLEMIYVIYDSKYYKK